MSENVKSYLDTVLPAAFKKYEVAPDTTNAEKVESWFKTEKLTLNFGEYVGRPDENIVAHTEQLSKLISEGWYVVAVRKIAGVGEWERVSSVTRSGLESSESSQEESSDSRANASSSSSTASKSSSDSSSLNETGGVEHSAFAHNKGESTSGGETSSDTTENNTGSASEAITKETKAEETSTEGGAQYWAAYQEIELERKRMQSDLVLQSMVEQFVRRFNEGHKINQDRYDELVSLYTGLQAQNEAELREIVNNTVDFQPLFAKIQDAFEKADGGIIAEYKKAVGDLPENWLENRLEDINIRFDNLKASEQSRHISIGLYNTTLWSAVAAGIEKRRASALDAAASEIAALKIDAAGKIASSSAGVYKELVDAEVRIMEAMQKRVIEPINMRNTVFKWMLEFMERRTDEIPETGDMATIAEKLGYSGPIAAPTDANGNPKGTVVS